MDHVLVQIILLYKRKFRALVWTVAGQTNLDSLATLAGYYVVNN